MKILAKILEGAFFILENSNECLVKSKESYIYVRLKKAMFLYLLCSIAYLIRSVIEVAISIVKSLPISMDIFEVIIIYGDKCTIVPRYYVQLWGTRYHFMPINCEGNNLQSCFVKPTNNIKKKLLI